MISDYRRNKKVDRSSWPEGPWDNEPDIYEWITSSGYKACASRLDTGAWVGEIEAPFPDDKDVSNTLSFAHTLRERKCGIGMVTKTDVTGTVHFCISFEHYKHPAPIPREHHWGEYKTLSEVIVMCNKTATHIKDLNDNPDKYVNYFKHLGMTK